MFLKAFHLSLQVELTLTKEEDVCQRLNGNLSAHFSSEYKFSQSTKMAATVRTLLLLAVTAICSGTLVVVNSGVKVTRGRSVFITEMELRINVGPTADCKVEVVMNEPITQRVGKLTPQVRPHLLQGYTFREAVQWYYSRLCSCRCLTAAFKRTR